MEGVVLKLLLFSFLKMGDDIVAIWSVPKRDYVGDVKGSNNVFDITEEHYALAKSRGLSRELVYSRVWKGMTVERAISKPVGNTNGKGLWTNWQGKSEVGKTAFYNNLKKGMEPEEAVKRQRVRGGRSESM